MPRVRVYCACSLDGFIAGPDDDLSWLPEGDPSAVENSAGVGFDAFIADIGALLMGRRTYDFVARFGGPWHYGDRPVLVATHRYCAPIHELVRPVMGDIGELVEQAKAVADGKDIYLDGGNLIRQALDVGLVDDLIITVIPTALGAGIPLFAGTAQRHTFECVSHETHGDVEIPRFRGHLTKPDNGLGGVHRWERDDVDSATSSSKKQCAWRSRDLGR